MDGMDDRRSACRDFKLFVLFGERAVVTDGASPSWISATRDAQNMRLFLRRL